MHQFHSRFLRSPARFTAITGNTGADHILPGVLPVAVSRHNVVQSKLMRFLATVLADITVTPKNLKPGHLFVLPGQTPYHGRQPDNRRHRKIMVNRVNKAGTIFQHLRFILINQDHRPTDPTDVKRLIALIQHQNRQVYHRNLFPGRECLILQKTCRTCNQASSALRSDALVSSLIPARGRLTGTPGIIVRCGNIEENAYLGIDKPGSDRAANIPYFFYRVVGGDYGG